MMNLFLWVFLFKVLGGVKKIFEGKVDLYPSQDFETYESCDSKISFHGSGIYKTEQKIKKSRKDRVTILGEKLSNIDDPRIMLEIFFPKNMIKSSKHLTKPTDQIIDM